MTPPPEEVIGYLEPGQLSKSLRMPLPKRTLNRRTQALLWLLRVYVLACIVVVVATFVKQLAH